MKSNPESSPAIFDCLSPSFSLANEEVFTFINHSAELALIFDFERRQLNSRCIVRVIDYRDRKVSEMRSRTLRFRIKSTFAPLPYRDEGITFMGGGFTASAIVKDGRGEIISALPDFNLPSGETGLKTRLSFKVEPEKPSFNRLYTKSHCYEAVHSSFSAEVNGTIRTGGVKREIDGKDYSLHHTWKVSTFPLKRHFHSSFCYGSSDSPFSFTLSLEEEKCILLYDNLLISYDGIKMERADKNEYSFTDGKGVSIKFSAFHTEREKTGPFRKNRTLRYGIFTGHIGTLTFSDSFGCMEM